MANPAKLTITPLVVNDDIIQGAGDAIDTNGTVPIVAADLGGATNRLLISVTEDNVRALTVTVLHGDNPPAVQQGLGTLTVAMAQAATHIIGPLDSSRFMQNDGTLQVAFAGTGGAATCHVRTYLLPKV